MTFSEIKQLQADERTLSLPFSIKRRRVVNSYIVINDMVAIPVENVASFYDRAIDLPIKLSDGTEIGYLYFIKELEVTNIFSLSEPKYICYLIDINARDVIDNGLPHTFLTDYVILYKDYLKEYVSDYLSCAPIWGSFNHKYPLLTINPPTKIALSEITVQKLPKFSKANYFEASVRGIKNVLAFERFLKYYHLLELNFDSDVIERIQKLNLDTEAGSISILLKEYKREDIERLKYLFSSHCSDTASIVVKLNLIASYLPIAKKIFYDFGTDSNPLKEYSQFNSIITNSNNDGFTLTNCKTARVQNATSIDTHRKFIVNLSAYWISRIRNSIAHNKIGEYVMSHGDESFVVRFAEPLLLELLRQLYK